MQPFAPSSKIYLSRSKIKDAGRGVFAAKEIRKDEVIERCPVIEIEEKDVADVKKTKLKNYYFMWGKNLERVVICIGFGSIYNHSYKPNATYKKRLRDKRIDFIAIKDIKKDEEITVNYNFGNPDDQTPLWIDSIESPME